MTIPACLVCGKQYVSFQIKIIVCVEIVEPLAKESGKLSQVSSLQ